jgi:hypothetical protein
VKGRRVIYFVSPHTTPAKELRVSTARLYHPGGIVFAPAKKMPVDQCINGFTPVGAADFEAA